MICDVCQSQCRHTTISKKVTNLPSASLGCCRHICTALLMEMGTGKSLTSIGVAGTLYQYGYINRLLIVAPLSITTVWSEEFEKFAAFSYTLTILEGSSDKKRKAIEEFSGSGLEVLVINYESAWRLEKELAAWQPDMIICDEGHKIKTHNTSVSKTMHRLGAAAKYRMLLTGTPVTNKALDIFSQYKFLNPAIFGRSFYTFRSRYFYMTGYGQHTPVMKDSMERDFTRHFERPKPNVLTCRKLRILSAKSFWSRRP